MMRQEGQQGPSDNGNAKRRKISSTPQPKVYAVWNNKVEHSKCKICSSHQETQVMMTWMKMRWLTKSYPRLDLGNGQFSKRCDVDGSFFNSDAIPIIFGKSLTSPSSRLFSLTIGNDYFSIILLILGPIILRLFTDWLGSSERKLY